MRKETIICDGCGNEILGFFYRIERKNIGPLGDESIEFLGLRNPSHYCGLSCIKMGEKAIE